MVVIIITTNRVPSEMGKICVTRTFVANYWKDEVSSQLKMLLFSKLWKTCNLPQHVAKSTSPAQHSTICSPWYRSVTTAY